jgi:hypothetical protein
MSYEVAKTSFNLNRANKKFATRPDSELIITSFADDKDYGFASNLISLKVSDEEQRRPMM